MDDMTTAIIDTYNEATPSQVERGRAWYAMANRIAAAIADATGSDTETAAYVMSATSPRNRWLHNVADTYATLAAVRDGTMPCLSVTHANRAKALRIARHELADPASAWSGSALKVRSFVRNILGDPEAVTVDVWAIRVATRGARSAVGPDSRYRAAERAYREAAAILGETPRDLQAITWIVLSEREGHASRNTFKNGTHAAVRAIVAAASDGRAS